MAKVDAIDAILESATQAIAGWGFEGASLRQIAAQAGVSLSMIDAYYGSKEQLFRAVLAAAWDDLACDIDASLQDATTRDATVSLNLEEVWLAIATPIVRRARSEDESAKRRLLVLARGREYLVGHGDWHRTLVDPTVVRWIQTMVRACPGLSWSDAVWNFSYGFSVAMSFQVVDRYYDKLIGVTETRSTESIARDVATFCSAGTLALEGRRRAQALDAPK